MKIIIDGKTYELPGEWLVKSWYDMTEKYVNPESDEARKYTDLRLAAKAALRLRLGSILKAFASIFRKDDWRELQPKRGEDMLVKLHQYVTGVLLLEAKSLVLELESEPGPELEGGDTDDRAGIMGTDTGTRLTLTGARFDGGQTLYQRPDAGPLDNATRPNTALGPAPSGSGLVGDADTPEILVGDTIQP